MENWVEKVGMASAIALPFFNIPLIVRLVRRKSSADFSLSWALGVWVCILFMTPQGLRSTDVSFRAYSAVNIVFFTIVTFFILKYHPKPAAHAQKENHP